MYKLTIQKSNRYGGYLYLNTDNKKDICNYLNTGLDLLNFSPSQEKRYLDFFDNEIIEFIKSCKEQFDINTDNFIFNVYDDSEDESLKDWYFIFSCPSVVKDYEFINNQLSINLSINKIEAHL